MVTKAMFTSYINAVIIDAIDDIVAPMKTEVRADSEPPTVIITSAGNIVKHVGMYYANNS